MASILSMNLNGRFRSRSEAQSLGQAILQRLLRGTDILFGQQAQFQPCLPGNYRMVGSPSAFIVYNCQLYSATEMQQTYCPVHDTRSQLPRGNWIASKIFFEQTCQEVLAISWFTAETIQTKRKREFLVRRLLNVARDLSSHFHIPVIIGGCFHLFVEDVNFILKDSNFDKFRCYGYWLDSVRRSIRVSDLFICTHPEIEMNHVRPRSLSGNICLGFKNNNWVNPEDSFYWDPLSAKIKITLNESPETFLSDETLTTHAESLSVHDTPTPLRRGTRGRSNFDVIRTTINNYETSKSAKGSPSNFALALPFSNSPSSDSEGEEYSKKTGLHSENLTSKYRRSPKSSKCRPMSRDLDEMKELDEILTRLRIGREVQIGADETTMAYFMANGISPIEADFGSGLPAEHPLGLTRDDVERMSSGQYTRKLSTISESGESSCSSFPDNEASPSSSMAELDATACNQLLSDEVLYEFENAKFFQKEVIIKRDSSLEGQTDESMEEKDGQILSSSVPSKQSSQEERIVEGSSDVDQDDKTIPSLTSHVGVLVHVHRPLEVGRCQESSLVIKDHANLMEAVRLGISTETYFSLSDFYEENRFESNFACCVM